MSGSPTFDNQKKEKKQNAANLYLRHALLAGGVIRGGPLDILGEGQENFPCKNFFLVESFVRNFFSW